MKLIIPENALRKTHQSEFCSSSAPKMAALSIQLIPLVPSETRFWLRLGGHVEELLNDVPQLGCDLHLRREKPQSVTKMDGTKWGCSEINGGS
jgi:hypothetical protein